MEKVVIMATRRTVTGKQVGALRRQGKLPGVLYGHNVEATPITMDLRDASRSLHGLTSSTLVNIDLDGKEHATLVREKQRNFITGTLLHVDFQAVSLTEKIRARVGVELTGLSPAVKDFNGYVVNGLTQLEVEAFPQDLPERIMIDLSRLAKIGDGIYVRDVTLGDKVEILSSPDDMLVIVTTTSEEVIEVPAAVEEPEVIEKGKKEEEEAAAAAAAAKK
jgi:large subunit ribosomal protein L25